MKTFKLSWAFIALAGLTFFSCEKENIEEPVASANPERLTEITHHYTYGNQTYTLQYAFDEKDNVVSCTGDTEQHERLQELSKTADEWSFLIEKTNDDQTVFHMRLFDNYAGLNTYCQTADVQDADRACDSYRNSGSSTFSFYEHADYVGEYTDLRRAFCSFFQQQWLDGANNQISSLKIEGGDFVDLFGESCFYGMRYRTYHSIANLHYVLVGFDWFTPVYAGDWCSSIKGYGN